MNSVFQNIFDMSVNAVWLIIAIWILRLIFQKAPKSWRSVLWGLVGFRLICPFSIPSSLSLVPTVQTTSTQIPTDITPIINSSIISSQTTSATENSVIHSTEEIIPSFDNLLSLGTIIWITGVCCMLLYAIISYIRLYKRTKESVPSGNGCWLCDRIQSPFILGIFRPKIFLPSTISEETIPYVTEHERSHLKRLDHWRKLFGYIILSIHWFNPLVWISYILFCRDIELSCDEKTTKNYEPFQKAGYSEALLYFSAPKNAFIVCPFSFGESGIKTRIKSVLNYKKPAFWLIIVAIISTVVVSICFMTKPNAGKIDLDQVVSQAILEHSSPSDENVFPTESHFIYGKRKSGNQITVYAQAYYQLFTIDNPLGIVETYGGSWCPCAITFEIDDNGNYTVSEYWEPDDGSLYVPSIMEKFPPILGFLAINNTRTAPNIDTSEVYEYFNASKTITFVSPDSGHLFGSEKGDAVLILDTETSTATLQVKGKLLLTDYYSFFDFDENGDDVPIYIYLCDVDNLPNNKFEYDFTVVDENTLCVTNLPEKPVFKRIDK